MRNKVHQYPRYIGLAKRHMGREDFKQAGIFDPQKGHVYWAQGQPGVMDLRTNFQQDWFMSPGNFRRFDINPSFGFYIAPSTSWPPQKYGIRVPRVVRIVPWVNGDRYTEKWIDFIDAIKAELADIDNLFVFNARPFVGGNPPTSPAAGRFIAAFTPRDSEIPAEDEEEPDFFGADVLNIAIYQTTQSGWYWEETDIGIAYEQARAEAPTIINQTYSEFIEFNKENDFERFKRAFPVYRGCTTWLFSDASTTGAAGLIYSDASGLNTFELHVTWEECPNLDCSGVCIPFEDDVEFTTGLIVRHTIGSTSFTSTPVKYCKKFCSGLCVDEVQVGTLDIQEVDDTGAIQAENLLGLQSVATDLAAYGVSYEGELTMTAAALAQDIKDYFGIDD